MCRIPFKRCFKIASLTDSSINIYGVAGDTDGIDGVSPMQAYISLHVYSRHYQYGD